MHTGDLERNIVNDRACLLLRTGGGGERWKRERGKWEFEKEIGAKEREKTRV